MSITTKVFSTPLGWVGAAAREGKLIAVVLPLASEAEVRARLPEGRGAEALLDRFEDDLRRAFAGEAVDFSTYPVDLSLLPEFHRRALEAIRGIPAGEVRSYTWVAQQLGRPGAARAAGQAMHANPVPLALPCHRVVGATGRLTGFGGGLELKRELLTLEGVPLKGNRVARAVLWGGHGAVPCPPPPPTSAADREGERGRRG